MRHRFEEFIGQWWRVLVSFAAVAVIAVMALVGWTLLQEQDQLQNQKSQLTELLESNRRNEATRDERLAEAVDRVDDALELRLTDHDADMQFMNSVLLYQIAQLINRPANEPVDPAIIEALNPPVSAPVPSHPTATTPRRPRASAPATTTTTRPDQRTCTKRPSGPRC